MNLNLKAISRNVGLALLVSALFMFFSLLVSIHNGNDSAFAALSISFIITFIVGFFPFIFVRKAPVISLSDGYFIIVLSWLLSFIFGMMPYLLWGGPFSVVNAFFESVSGFTTTGATILQKVEEIPNSLLFWRSSTHFIGGLGVVVFLLLIIPSSSPVKLRLTNLELSSLSKSIYHVRANKTVLIYTSVYIGLTLAAFLCYWIAGMSAFDAINHAFSVCSTGGFSTKNDSIASFNSDAIAVISIIFMFICSVHFGLIFYSFIQHSFKPLNNPIFKFYTKAVIIGAIIISLVLKYEHIEDHWWKAILSGTFNVVTYISTTGFGYTDNANWPALPNIILMVLALMCGCAGSTSGGIKADRVYILFKSIKRQIRRVVHPTYIEDVKIGNHILKDEELAPITIFICMYIVLILISMLICLISGLELENSLLASVVNLGNVGPAVGQLGTFGNYDLVPSGAKIMLTLDMFLGRIEIYPIFAVFCWLFQKENS